MYIIVVEYLNGGSFASRLMVAIPWDEALRTLWDIGVGLAFAYQNNVIYGNLKSSNILFDKNTPVKLTDVGRDEYDQ